MELKEKINLEKLPQHIAIIMDGNGRWAKQQGEQRIFGHENGVKSVRDTVEAAAELGVKYLTLYAFSTENWNRPQEEVIALMQLLVHTISAETKTLNENKIRLQAIGDLKSLPDDCFQELQDAIEKTKHNTRTTLVLALSYSSRWEITNAIKQIAEQIENKKLTAAEKRKKKDIVMAMKKSFKGNKGVMYAIATDKAKKMAEDLDISIF